MDKKTLAKLLVLYTGGTIGMIPNRNGVLIPVSNKLFDNIKKRPDMHDVEGYEKLSESVKSPSTCLLPHLLGYKERIVYTLKEYDPLLDSSKMCSNDWEKIAADIENNYDAYDAFVILHGTDTLSYTASFLSFCLENLNKTVVVTGSYVSIFETRTDGITNFTNALIVAGMNSIPEVCVVFGRKLMRGNRSAKVSTIDFDAFDSPNAPVLGLFHVDVEINKSQFLPMPKSATLKVQKELNTNIVVLRVTPNLRIEILKAVLAAPTEGVILQTFGMGNVPSNREDFLDEIIAASKRGVIIVNTTQCRHGGVEPKYETGQILGKCGVIPGHDMTEEAAYTKLAYILAQDLSVDAKRKKMQENLRGELTLPTERKKRVVIVE